MVKIFVGNVQEGANSDDLRLMFEKYGPVSECDVLTNFAFVVSISLVIGKLLNNL